MSDKNDDKEKGKEKEKSSPIIIRKINKASHGHHGGSWKIAYADFVTAMMAFFLLMWLISSLNKAQKEGISEYFKQPLKISLMSGKNVGEQSVSVQGGGNDIKKKMGESASGQQPLKDTKQGIKIQNGQSKELENQQLEKLKSNITLVMAQDPALANIKDHLLMDNVAEGLRIQLIDNMHQPMFEIGSDVMDHHMQEMLNKIAKVLIKMPNKIIIQGHTDGHPYQDPDKVGLTNWELSTLRANAARRALVNGGMPEEKVMEVSGYASTMLLDGKNPLNPNNRRISIIVMKKAAENNFISKTAEPTAPLPTQPPPKK